MQSIVLIGFMGAGKTTVGAELAARTNRSLCDLDADIVSLAAMSIPQIFASRGESYFRDLETMVLRSINRQKDQVIATGGGIVERTENWPLLRDLGQTVYLQASWAVLRQRLSSTAGRPLANAQDGWEKVEALFLKREPLYLQADYVVNTDGIDARQVAEVIQGLIQG